MQPRRTPGRRSLTSQVPRPERIFPEEAPGEDRIPDQLMFLPSTVPESQVRIAGIVSETMTQRVVRP